MGPAETCCFRHGHSRKMGVGTAVTRHDARHADHSGFGFARAETWVICMPGVLSRNSGADTSLSSSPLPKVAGFDRARDESPLF